MRVSYQLRKPKVSLNTGVFFSFRIWHGKEWGGWGGFDLRLFNLKLSVTYGGPS